MERIPKMQECFVRLDRIDVSAYRQFDQNTVRIQEEYRMIEGDVAMEDNHENEAVVIENEDDEVVMKWFSSWFLCKRKENEKQRGRKPRSIWTRKWLEKRQDDGVYAKLLQELRIGDSGEKKLYRDFLRMSEENFIDSLRLVQPLIQKTNTKFRESISAIINVALSFNWSKLSIIAIFISHTTVHYFGHNSRGA